MVVVFMKGGIGRGVAKGCHQGCVGGVGVSQGGVSAVLLEGRRRGHRRAYWSRDFERDVEAASGSIKKKRCRGRHVH
jgi:hypothetical protein